ncbi:MAG: hypothetical protein VYC39_13225 [Myxococcota bacterium]|nr:hypothetical protein [Myxococcota bacterium]
MSSQSGLQIASHGRTALEEVLSDDSITEVLIRENTPMSIWRDGTLEERDSPFAGAQLLPALKKIAQDIGQPLSRTCHCVRGALPSGWLLTICDGKENTRSALLNARRLPVLGDHNFESLRRSDIIDERLAKILIACVETRANIVVVGGTRSRVRGQVLAAIGDYWAAQNHVLALEYPFWTPSDHPRAQIIESKAIFDIDANLGEAIVACDPSADTLTSMLMLPPRVLIALDGKTMSEAINSMISYLSYVRPGMILKGIESMITSRIDLLVLCDGASVTALGEPQYWQDRLTIRALAQRSASGYLVDLRGSHLRERLLTTAPELVDSAAEDLEVRSEDEKSQPLGMTPLVTSVEQRRVSDAFILDNEERSFQEIIEPDRMQTPVIDEAREVLDAASNGDEELSNEITPPGQDTPAGQDIEDQDEQYLAEEEELAPVVPQNLSEEDEEVHTEIGASSEATDEPFVDDMPSRTYNLADESEAFSEELDLPEVSQGEGSLSSRRGQVQHESQATMIINQAEIDIDDQLAPSSDHVSEGPGRSNERTPSLQAQKRGRKP